MACSSWSRRISGPPAPVSALLREVAWRVVGADPSQVLDGLVADGREPGGAVAVVPDGVVEVDHRAGTRDGSSRGRRTRW